MISTPWFFVGIGGFLGAIFRYEIGGIIQNTSGFEFFPKGTLFVNVLGSLFLGFIFTLYQYDQIGQNALLLFGTGFSGAFTTFSTFALETAQLNQSHGLYQSLTNIGVNVIFSLIGIFIGIIIGNFLLKNYLTS
ncbi:MAG: fluoride efflux transporter CrcB [Candidatus Heimdallarchaeota archaeon]